MHPGKLITPLALGVAAGAILRHRRARRAAAAARVDDFASDPGDPVQGFDEASELQVAPLDVDALSQADAEAADDLAGLETELDEVAARDAAAFAADFAADHVVIGRAHPRDAGELHGVHTPPAVDRDHLDDDQAFDTGQNWIEALETSAIENGAEPERTLDDIIDDTEVLRPPHAPDTRDTPVADRGSAGRRGL